ncbi:MAG: hypothetical protein QG555_24 [Thermodesulfobacteriota bacterium]|nr:hypothetical protein [Thermodesulfobacteriota bacterium]
MIILDFYLNVCHCKQNILVTQDFSYINCSRRCTRRLCGAKLSLFSSFAGAPIIKVCDDCHSEKSMPCVLICAVPTNR